MINLINNRINEIKKERYMEPKLLTYKESKEARQRAHKLVEDVRKHSKIKGHFKFYTRLIGSAKRRCIIKDLNGKYDLDYQIVLTKNSADGDKDPTKIKKAFLEAFTKCKNRNEKVEDSTTVVTVRASKSEEKFESEVEKFSFDFVIISIDETKRIRRNGKNQYTWNELPSKNSDIYEKFNNLSGNEQRNLLEKYVIQYVIKEKQKRDESKRKPSIDIFYEGVNNYYNEHHF